MAGIASDMIRGNTDTILLRFLCEKDSYGYEINKQIQKLTEGLVYKMHISVGIYEPKRRTENASRNSPQCCSCPRQAAYIIQRFLFYIDHIHHYNIYLMDHV